MKRIKFLQLFIVLSAFFTLSTLVFAEGDEFDGYIVTLKESIDSGNVGSLLSEDIGQANITGEQAAKLLSEENQSVSEIYSSKRLIKVADEETLSVLTELGAVESSEPDYIAELYGYEPEQNPRYSQQWALSFINASYAWDAGIFGNDVRVAVIDSGVYPNMDLDGNIAQGFNFFNNTTDTTDTIGHGTSVAGIISAQCNSTGIVGIAHRATIVPLYVVNESGGAPVSCIIPAIYAAVDDYDCDVINMSFGLKVSNDALKEAIDHAEAKGCIMVAAAGNDGTDSQYPYRYPASYSNVISVANACLSNTAEGQTCAIYSSSQKNDKIDIAAPGTGIYSTSKTENGTSSRIGTSFSSPMVAAAAALVKCAAPEINQEQFTEYLKSTADSSYLTEAQDSNCWGSGMLDIAALIKAVVEDKPAVLSEIDDEPFTDNVSVYIHNPTKTTADYTLKITDGKATAEIPITINAIETAELSLLPYAFSGNITINLYDAADSLISSKSAKAEGLRIIGDIMYDGVVDSLDAVMLAQYLAGWDIEFTEPDALAADVLRDDATDSPDAVKLAQYLAGWTGITLG